MGGTHTVHSAAEAGRDRTGPASHVLRWAVGLLLALAIGSTGQPAWADEGESTDEGYIMVQQALSFLVSDPGPDGSA